MTPKRIVSETVQEPIWSGLARTPAQNQMGNASLKQGIWPHKRHREVVSVTHDNTQLWGVFCKSSDQCRPKPGPPGAILLDTRELWTDRPLLSLSRHSQAPGTFWENTINPYITIKASKNRALVTNPKMSTHS